MVDAVGLTTIDEAVWPPTQVYELTAILPLADAVKLTLFPEQIPGAEALIFIEG